MKHPKYVFKRINGQRYVYGIGDPDIKNPSHEKEKDLARES
jgi:hypothetical protein